MARFKWTEQTEQAASLIAQGRLSLDAIAEEVGVDRKTLFAWRKQAVFQARVDEELDLIRSEARRRGVAILENRLAGINHRHNLIMSLINARADDPLMAEAAGGFTGLLARSVKRVVVERNGEVESSREVADYRFDPGPLRELRDLERHAAIELGEWQSGKDKGSVDPDQMANEVEDRSAQYDRATPDPTGEVPGEPESD